MSECGQDGLCDTDVERVPSPKWLKDEPEIMMLLNKLLDGLDRLDFQQRKRAPVIRLTKSICPLLFRHSESSVMSWNLLRSLDSQIFRVDLKSKQGRYAAEYEGARLTLLPHAEPILRHWLQRPKAVSYAESWQRAVYDYRQLFADEGLLLSMCPVQIKAWEAGEVVQRFARMSHHAQVPVTLRQLSACYFDGDSKLLDGREDLIARLFPQLVISYRPLIIHASLPERLESLLFIENQDTYVQLLKHRPGSLSTTGLIYSAGFRATAARVRSGEEVCFHYASSSSLKQQAYFESFWCGQNAMDLNLEFWGDLDYSAMAILKLLRQRFQGMAAWQPGYSRLCNMLQDGFGHPPDHADKEDQRDPEMVGCVYADEKILPLLRQHKRFVDQEALLALE